MTSLLTPGWSLTWSIISLVVLAYGSYWLARAVLAYSELWRVLGHKAVKKTVKRELDSGNIESIMKMEQHGENWGSLHGLRLIYDLYQNKKSAALPDSTSEISRDRLIQAMNAGNALVCYLDIPWAENVLDEANRRWLQLDTARELLTIYLSTQTEELNKNSMPLSHWKNLLQQADDPFHQFLQLCFDLGACKQQDLRKVKEILPNALNLYSQEI